VDSPLRKASWLPRAAKNAANHPVKLLSRIEKIEFSRMWKSARDVNFTPEQFSQQCTITRRGGRADGQARPA
jgi:hypothetical protein